MFEYNLYSIYIILSKSFFITIIIKYAPVDGIDNDGSFEFYPKAEFTSTLQQALK